MKTYKARSNVSINVMLPSGKSKHISFTPLTGGGSVYYAHDDGEIAAIEKHQKYGKLFKEVSVKPPAAQKKAKKATAQTEPTEVAVNCEEDAKNILCDRYGYSRTKLKRIEQIKKAAAEVNIVFTGI